MLLGCLAESGVDNGKMMEGGRRKREKKGGEIRDRLLASVQRDPFQFWQGLSDAISLRRRRRLLLHAKVTA